jgi:hypothetical protein
MNHQGVIILGGGMSGFKDNQARLSAAGGFALAYNLANFLRRLALPRDVKHWSLIPARRDYERNSSRSGRR